MAPLLGSGLHSVHSGPAAAGRVLEAVVWRIEKYSNYASRDLNHWSKNPIQIFEIYKKNPGMVEIDPVIRPHTTCRLSGYDWSFDGIRTGSTDLRNLNSFNWLHCEPQQSLRPLLHCIL